MDRAKLSLLCSFGFCVLALTYTSSHVTTASLPSFSSLRSWAPWLADLEAKLTPPLLFLLLNLVVAALLITNSGFLRLRKLPPQNSNGGSDLQANIDGGRSSFSRKKAMPSSAIIGSSTPGTLQAPDKKSGTNVRELNRSKSDKLQVPGMASSSADRSSEQGAAAQMKPQADQSARKKKKKRSASSGMEEAIMNRSSANAADLKKAPSAPPLEAGRKNGDDDGGGGGEAGDEDEVNRRAEEFIGKFYMQMRMQRLASIERYHQRLDRSYGR